MHNAHAPKRLGATLSNRATRSAGGARLWLTGYEARSASARTPSPPTNRVAERRCCQNDPGPQLCIEKKLPRYNHKGCIREAFCILDPGSAKPSGSDSQTGCDYLPAAMEFLRNSFMSFSSSRLTLRARAPAALLPFSTCAAASLANASNPALIFSTSVFICET